MSLANLANLSEENIQAWEFFNAAQHEEIVARVAALYGIQLPSYPLYYIPGDYKLWEEQHQESHDNFCSLLGIAGNDYSVLDLKDKAKLQAWIDLHLDEHRQANAILGIA